LFAFACVAGVVQTLLPGCDPSTATVSGLVTLRGKPAADGSVVFYCADKQIVRGLIGADGRYSIPNVPFGKTVVTVQSHPRVPPGLKMQQNLPPAKYGPVLPPSTGDPARPGVTIPARYALPEESGLSVVVDRTQLTYDIELKQ
jgi:hypothetical protein